MDIAVKPVQTGRGQRQHLLAYSPPLTALSVTQSQNPQ